MLLLPGTHQALPPHPWATPPDTMTCCTLSGRISEIRVVSYEKCTRVAESPCKADLEGRPVEQLSGPL